ncbi:TetR family transcriptional regulator [Azoarcus indigens]|uniref:TetR family transcriptional regulator n=1 Tax=Azoarcus indigens TaxID=29545 RepID=A0A4R6DYV5_9RHOO|nr:TetR/AcrR family transcriptional regulator [Azoarcus indigens]NMG65114.1 TetR family transcriptional regulator [Azoarcus indigens]TDN49628.1 TetR family transcriptional regulator [Azoarcus indigens]
MKVEKAAAGAEAKGRVRRRQEAAILKAAEQVFAGAGYRGATMAAIADRAGLPKANLHYYFGTKAEVYRAVLGNILALWLAETDRIRPEAEPREALAGYVAAKMQLTAARPDASRVFANELLHGAVEIGAFLRQELRAHVADKARVIDGWIAAGRMAPVDSTHLFFSIWALTQTYADFAPQVCAVLGRKRLDRAALDRAGSHVANLVLRGCGLPAD